MTSDFATSEDVPVIVRTLVANGFALDNALRRATSLLLEFHRYDEFGVAHPYTFAVAEQRLTDDEAQSIATYAAGHQSQTVVIGNAASEAVLTVSFSEFLALLGGPVESRLPLEPGFKEHLVALGHNREIEGMVGRPDTLFEDHVYAGLLFVLDDRVLKYGQERRFEPVPDGLAFSQRRPLCLYDAKAAASGYEVTAESIRQFGDYVREFHRRYEGYLGRLHSFVVVSGAFINGPESRQTKSADLGAACGVRLTFLTASDLSDIVALLANHPASRRSLDWPRLLANLQLQPSHVEAAIRSVINDKVLRA